PQYASHVTSAELVLPILWLSSFEPGEPLHAVASAERASGNRSRERMETSDGKMGGAAPRPPPRLATRVPARCARDVSRDFRHRCSSNGPAPVAGNVARGGLPEDVDPGDHRRHQIAES